MNQIQYGTVPQEPEEYSSYTDWADRAKFQAYYLDGNGNLVYDAERAASLPAEDEIIPYTSDQLKAMGVIDAIRNEIDTTIYDAIYPVGSIYMTVNDVSPEILFGGSWERIEDRFLLAAGVFSVGSTGGAESYNLSIDAHKHTISTFDNVKFVSGAYTDGTFDIPITGTTEKSGSVSKTIPTMPPYLAVFVWKRTA